MFEEVQDNEEVIIDDEGEQEVLYGDDSLNSQ